MILSYFWRKIKKDIYKQKISIRMYKKLNSVYLWGDQETDWWEADILILRAMLEV